MFARLLSASFYAFSIQGRPQAISQMTAVQAEQLLLHGRVKTKNFKTKRTYVYQMVTVLNDSARLLSIYRDTLLPVLLEKSTSVPKTFLLNYNGKTCLQVGRRVVEFFQQSLGLHLTTSSCRSMVETYFEKLCMQGKLHIKI